MIKTEVSEIADIHLIINGDTIACESCNEEVCDQMINITIILL